MNLTTAQIAEAFSRHDFATTYPYLSDDVQWNLVGKETLSGKETVITTCEQSAAYLKTVTTTFSRFFVVVGDNGVVIDSISDYVDADQQTSRVASCDIYEFADGKITQITSYTIELGNGES